MNSVGNQLAANPPLAEIGPGRARLPVVKGGHAVEQVRGAADSGFDPGQSLLHGGRMPA